MFIETSALVAILGDEVDAEEFMERIYNSDRRLTSVVNMVESTLSLGKRIGNYADAASLLRSFVEEMDVSVVGIHPEIFDDVVHAYTRYGRGTGHPAKLNFGDCFSYALAKRGGETLLFKGSDFSRTDLKPAV